MWLITGPFDSEQLGDEESLKTKVLKANTVYPVSRYKVTPLYINHKKISRQHGEFIVGEHSEDDVSNGALVPMLSLRNNKTSAMKIKRKGEFIVMNPDSTHELETDDTIYLTGSISAEVKWDPKICFYTHTDTLAVFDLSACASLGVKLVTKHSRDVTHHLTSNISSPLSPAVLYSLLTPALFVKPDWVIELIRRKDDLEKTYDPPLEKRFRPVVDSLLTEQHPNMAKSAAWDPKESRKALFDGMRFVFVVLGSGAGSLAKAMADVVSRGGADRQLINVEKEAEEQAKGTTGIWAAALKKRIVQKEGMRSGLMLVGEEDTMTARGVPKEVGNTWKAMVEKARSVDMRVIHPSLIVEAVFNADISVLDCVSEKTASTEHAQSLPHHIPSTHPEEPSQLLLPTASQTLGAGPSRRLTRRVTPQTPAPEPTPPPPAPMEVEEQHAAIPVPRKPLKRRAKTGGGGLVNEILGIDESTVLLDASQSQGMTQPVLPTQDLVTPTPARAGRLKRRAGTQPATSQLPAEPQSTLQDIGEEQTLKKFKALFDESGHSGADQAHGGMSGGISADTELEAVIEEEEEFQSQMQTQKRKTDTAMEEVEERGVDVVMQEAEGLPARKRRAIEAVNAVEPSQHLKPPPTTRPASGAATKGKAEAEKAKGAMPDKPDADVSFMRAIASNKRGKKTEDEFDREFNKLRIAKPEINKAGARTGEAGVGWEQAWDGLGDFEKDMGIRGNFMQILEMEVWKDVREESYQPGRNTRRESGLGARVDWNGREDFKKFRRKMDVQPRARVQLAVSEPQNSGIGYWGSKDNGVGGFDEEMSQSQDQFSQPRFTQTQSAPKSRLKPQPKSKAKSAMFEERNEDDEVEDELSGDARRKGKSKAPATAKGRTSQSAKKKQALFEMGSEDEDASLSTGAGETLEEDISSTLPSTMKTTQARSSKRGAKRKVAVVEDSDSDDGMTLGGFAKKKKVNSRR